MEPSSVRSSREAEVWRVGSTRQRPGARRARHRDGLRRAGRGRRRRVGRARLPPADLLVLAQLRVPDAGRHRARRSTALPWRRALPHHAARSPVRRGGRTEGVDGGHGASPRSSTSCRRGEDLDELREKFLTKAFQRRQEAVLLGLREAGLGGRRHPRARLRRARQRRVRAGADASGSPRYLDALRGAVSAGAATADPRFRRPGRASRSTRPSCRDYLAKLRARAHQHGVQRRALPRPASRRAIGRRRRRRRADAGRLHRWGRVPAAAQRRGAEISS